MICAVGLALSLALVLTGCDRDKEVRSYQAPKDTPAATVADSGATPTESADLTAPGDLRWTLPADWKQIPPPAGRQGIRATAAIQIPGTPPMVMTISRLGEGARVLAPNVSRWAGMIKLSPPSPEDATKFVTHSQHGDVSSDVIDLNNPANQQRLLGALVPHESDTWAFKVSGPSDQIAAQKAKFDEFIASLKFESAAPAPAPVTQGPPTPSADGGSGATGVENAHWTLPVGWTAEATPGQMRLATIHPGNGAALIKVSKFASVGGGLGVNVSRWRREVGLDPVDDAHADSGTKITVGGGACTIHDYTGPANGGTRLIVAAVEVNGETWYFKLSGPEAEVTAQKAAFDQFLGSLKFGQ